MKKINAKHIINGVKEVGKAVIGFGAASIVSAIVKSNTDGLLKAYEKPCAAVATFLTGCLLGDKIVNYVEDQIINFANEIKEARERAESIDTNTVS